MNKDLLNLTNEILFYNDKISDNKIKIACRLDFILETNLLKDSYQDIYDYSSKELKLKRTTINSYLDVVNRYCEKKIAETFEKSKYKIKIPYDYFNFSQLKACLGLTDKEIIDLGIDETISVHDIEKIKRNYKRGIYDPLPFTEDQEENQEISEEDPETFNSINDIKRNINIFEENYIPDNSEYEIILRKDKKSLIRTRKKEFDFNTCMKHLKILFENNSEENFYYAVVKIKKPL